MKILNYLAPKWKNTEGNQNRKGQSGEMENEEIFVFSFFRCHVKERHTKIVVLTVFLLIILITHEVLIYFDSVWGEESAYICLFIIYSLC